MARMLPHPPTVDGLSHHGIRDNEYAIVPTTDILWRVHRTTSSHALAWNELARMARCCASIRTPSRAATIRGTGSGAGPPMCTVRSRKHSRPPARSTGCRRRRI